MNETNNTFKKAPKRKSDKGRRVTISPEMRQAYADIIKDRQEKDETYARHLPQNETKNR